MLESDLKLYGMTLRKQGKSKKNIKINLVIYQIKPVIGSLAKKNIIKYIKKDNWITEYKNTIFLKKSFQNLQILNTV